MSHMRAAAKVPERNSVIVVGREDREYRRNIRIISPCLGTHLPVSIT
jgi:hypothetical protein